MTPNPDWFQSYDGMPEPMPKKPKPKPIKPRTHEQPYEPGRRFNFHHKEH